MKSLEWPAGTIQTCIAGESSIIRALRYHLRNERKVPKADTYISGYWKIGLVEDEHQQLWEELVEFPACPEAPLVIQATVVPSGTTTIARESRLLDPACSIQAHAASGIVVVRFAEFPEDGLSRTLVGTLQPVAATAHGNVVILSNPSGREMTPRSTWGEVPAPLTLLSRIKNNFDPGNVLNPGRFVYP